MGHMLELALLFWGIIGLVLGRICYQRSQYQKGEAGVGYILLSLVLFLTGGVCVFASVVAFLIHWHR